MDQLDIFADSRDRVLVNRLAEALVADDPDAAHSAADALRAEFPADRHLPLAALLADVLTAEMHAVHAPWPADAAPAALTARKRLEQQVAPAAQQMLGSADAGRWLAARWRALAQRAAALPYARAHADTHAAALWLQAGAWAEALRAAEAIASWHRRPAPLAWVAQARWHLAGADAAWPLLAELCWLAPTRVPPLLALLPDAGMRKLARRFENGAAADLQAEAAAGPVAASPKSAPSPAHLVNNAGPADQVTPATPAKPVEPARTWAELWAWWPAWLLIEQPLLADPLAGAQAHSDGAAEQAYTRVRSLLQLERQGRHHDLIAQRRQLLESSRVLFGCYMATR